jgi:hypothetical protein
MNKATHTKGPWHIGQGNGEGSIFCESGRTRLESGGTTLYPVCDIVRGWDEAEDLANAHLIASAPDLLAALRTIANMKCDGDLWHGNEDGENVTNDEEHDAFVEALCIAREAIARTEGAQ